jgi:hypothetical protein
VRAPSRCAALACVLAATSSGAPQAALERVNRAAADGRYEQALEAARELEDPALAAEWASYLHSAAGDLPGALREARAGLAKAPQHTGLLTQALNASLALGLAGGAGELAERLLAASAGAEEAQRAHALELAGRARELELGHAQAERGVSRARALVLAGLTASVLALVALARGRD